MTGGRRAAVAGLLGLLGAAAAACPAAAQAPAISAPNAIVVDAPSGDVLYARGASERRPIASATKLMTALLVLEGLELGDTVTAVRYRSFAAESRLGLRAGERLTVADMIRGLLLASANDAAAALAEAVAGSVPAFVKRMNARAEELGLTGTSFANPIGLDEEGNHSTPRDLARLTIELRRFPFFRKVVNQSSSTLRSGDRVRRIYNRNRLVSRVPWIDGVKTGHTLAAGYVLIGSGRRNGVSLISVVLGTPSETARENDTVALLRYGFGRFRQAVGIRKGDVVASVPIRFREGARLALVASRTVRRTIRKRTRLELGRPEVPVEVSGPIRPGQKLGAVDVLHRGRPITRVSLVAGAEVPEAGFGRRANDWFTRPSTLGLASVAALTGLAGFSLLRRARRRSEPSRHPEVTAT